MKNNKTEQSFKDAAALGEIHVAPEVAEVELDEKPQREDVTIDNTEDFRLAVGTAQMDGIEYVEVGEKLFKYLLRGAKTRYLTYGNPGIKVFLKGTMDDILDEEEMSAEDYGNVVARRRHAEVQAEKALKKKNR